MPKGNIEDGPDIVSSIFERAEKKRPSSLFTYKQPKAPAQEAPQQDSPKDYPRTPVAKAPVIKKRLPIGIDIGASSIKMLQLGYDQENTVKIINLAIEEIPRQAQENPKERDAVVLSLLKKIVGGIGLKGENCFASAPAALGSVNFIALPNMPANEISQAVQWAVKETTHTDIKELVLDYIPLENQGPRFLGDQIGILAVTAVKKAMFEYMAFLESAGLSPLAIDVEPLADIAGLGYAKKLNPREMVILLDFGAGKTSINMVCDGELILTRAMSATGNSLTSMISSYCNVSWQEAEEMKKGFGLALTGEGRESGKDQEKATQVRNAMLPLLENMMQDIEQAFKYFSYRVTKSQITRFDRVILSGGSSFMPALVPFLTNRLNVPVEIVDSLSGLSALDKKYQEKLGSLSPRLNVALGLALRGMGS